jgi:hypothetical protein
LHHKKLGLELLEDRRLLAIGSHPLELPGLLLVDPSVDRFDGQIIYLDFDGADNVTYHGPVTIGPFDVPAYHAPTGLAGQEREILADSLASLNGSFNNAGIIFVEEQPGQGIEYSTLYIGGDVPAFRQYGLFDGLAENVDVGNINHNDSAFVFSANIPRKNDESDESAAIVRTIAHEVAHLIGYAHASQINSGEILNHNSGSEYSILNPVAHKIGPPDGFEGAEVHQWITLQAAKFYNSQFSGSELWSNYLVTPGHDLTPASNWDNIENATHTWDTDNSVLEGSRDQDIDGQHPLHDFFQVLHSIVILCMAEIPVLLMNYWLALMTPGFLGTISIIREVPRVTILHTNGRNTSGTVGPMVQIITMARSVIT